MTVEEAGDAAAALLRHAVGLWAYAAAIELSIVDDDDAADVLAAARRGALVAQQDPNVWIGRRDLLRALEAIAGEQPRPARSERADVDLDFLSERLFAALLTGDDYDGGNAATVRAVLRAHTAHVASYLAEHRAALGDGDSSLPER